MPKSIVLVEWNHCSCTICAALACTVNNSICRNSVNICFVATLCVCVVQPALAVYSVVYLASVAQQHRMACNSLDWYGIHVLKYRYTDCYVRLKFFLFHLDQKSKRIDERDKGKIQTKKTNTWMATNYTRLSKSHLAWDTPQFYRVILFVIHFSFIVSPLDICFASVFEIENASNKKRTKRKKKIFTSVRSKIIDKKNTPKWIRYILGNFFFTLFWIIAIYLNCFIALLAFEIWQLVFDWSRANAIKL